MRTYFQDPYPNNKRSNFESLFKEFELNVPRLLVLGEPGSSKTVLLLEFALEILKQCKNDPNYPAPILVDVASWRNEDTSFEDWLQKNLVFAAGEFGTSKRNAADLMIEDNMILLFDGLDEIEEYHRDSFLTLLDEYVEKLENRKIDLHKFERLAETPLYPQMILSSRIAEYQKTSGKTPVNASIIIEPLKEEAILEQLDKIKARNGSAKILSEKIRENPKIVLTLNTAFGVHIALTLAHHFDFNPLSWEKLLIAYIERELGIIKRYHKDDSKRYLKNLANNLSKSNKAVSFELTDINPLWLTFPILYFILQPFLACYFMINAVQFVGQGEIPAGENIMAIIMGIVCCVCSMILFGLKWKSGLLNRLPKRKKTPVKVIRIRVTLIAIPWFFAFGIVHGWSYLHRIDVLIETLIGSFIGAFLFDLTILRWLPRMFFFLADYLDVSRIQTDEVRQFSFRGFTRQKFKENFRRGFVDGFYIFLLYFIADFLNRTYSFFATNDYGWVLVRKGNYEYREPIISSFSSWEFIFFAFVIGGALGLTRGFIDSFYVVTRLPKISKPYSRLRAQIKFEVIQWSFVMLFAMFISKQLNPFQVVLVGYFIAFLTSPLFKHLVIRAILFTERKFPFRLARFLNTAANTGLMEKDGGLWRFRHQLIKNYFMTAAE